MNLLSAQARQAGLSINIFVVCIRTQVNSIQSKIKSMTRQMMATVSELSMHQATAMRLQQEAREKEALLERYHVNMENGLPPSVDIEHEFLRLMRSDDQRQQDRHKVQLVGVTIN